MIEDRFDCWGAIWLGFCNQTTNLKDEDDNMMRWIYGGETVAE